MTAKKKPAVKAAGPFTPRQIEKLIAYVRDEWTDPLPKDIRAEIHDVLQALWQSVVPAKRGRPRESDRRLIAARVAYELIEHHGLEQNTAIAGAIKLLRLPQFAKENDRVAHIYRDERDSAEFLAINLPPLLVDAFAEKIRAEMLKQFPR